MSKQTREKVQDFARNVWLAGLGAYGKGSETLTKKLDQAYEESNQLFNELVGKGTEIQASLEAKIKEQTAFENKVDEVREKLGLNTSVSDEQIDALTAKVDALTEIVAQLAERKLAEAQAQADAPSADAASAEAQEEPAPKPTRARKSRAKANQDSAA